MLVENEMKSQGSVTHHIPKNGRQTRGCLKDEDAISAYILY